MCKFGAHRTTPTAKVLDSRGDIFAMAKMGRVSGFWRFLGKYLGTGQKIPYWEPTGENPWISGPEYIPTFGLRLTYNTIGKIPPNPPPAAVLDFGCSLSYGSRNDRSCEPGRSIFPPAVRKHGPCSWAHISGGIPKESQPVQKSPKESPELYSTSATTLVPVQQVHPPTHTKIDHHKPRPREQRARVTVYARNMSALNHARLALLVVILASLSTQTVRAQCGPNQDKAYPPGMTTCPTEPSGASGNMPARGDATAAEYVPGMVPQASALRGEIGTLDNSTNANKTRIYGPFEVRAIAGARRDGCLQAQPMQGLAATSGQVCIHICAFD